jgi:hypothetical protein
MRKGARRSMGRDGRSIVRGFGGSLFLVFIEWALFWHWKGGILMASMLFRVVHYCWRRVGASEKHWKLELKSELEHWNTRNGSGNTPEPTDNE